MSFTTTFRKIFAVSLADNEELRIAGDGETWHLDGDFMQFYNHEYSKNTQRCHIDTPVEVHDWGGTSAVYFIQVDGKKGATNVEICRSLSEKDCTSAEIRGNINTND